MQNQSIIHHFPQADWCPASLQVEVLGRLHFFFIAKHDDLWYGMPFWPVWVCCPGCVTSQSLVHPQSVCLQGHSEKHRGPVQQYLNIDVLSALVLVTIPKHSFIQGCFEESYSIRAKTGTLCFTQYLPCIPLLLA